jgi:hypothetical protein
MSDSSTPQDDKAMSPASAGSGVGGVATAQDTKGFAYMGHKSLASVLRSLAMDYRLESMPAKFRFSMLEAAKRLG